MTDIDKAKSEKSTHTTLHSVEASQSLDAAELAALRAIMEGMAQSTGEEFFRLLVRNLSVATGVSNAFIAEFADTKTRVRSLAFWMNGQLVPNQEWELAGTPCEEVVRGNLCPSGVWKQYPKEEGVESYLGVPLQDPEGSILGHLAIFDSRVMPPEPRLLFTFQIFAVRAAAELGRIRAVDQLRESEERFRDLFDEAPIAYVHEDVESRFISANRAAMRILGITPEQVPGMVGKSFVPNTPDAQRRLKQAFESVGRGTDTSGVVLERRRARAPSQGQRQAHLDPVVVQARSQRALHAHHVRRHYRPRADGARTGSAAGPEPVSPRGNQIGP